MGRPQFALPVVVCLLLTAAGCTTAPLSSPFDDAGVSVNGGRGGLFSRLPFRRRTQSNAESPFPTPAQSPAKQAAATFEEAQTLAKIETELQGMSPNKREEWHERIKDLSPDTALLVLETRRLARQVGGPEQQRESFEPAGATQFAGHSTPQGSPRPNGSRPSVQLLPDPRAQAGAPGQFPPLAPPAERNPPGNQQPSTASLQPANSAEQISNAVLPPATVPPAGSPGAGTTPAGNSAEKDATKTRSGFGSRLPIFGADGKLRSASAILGSLVPGRKAPVTAANTDPQVQPATGTQTGEASPAALSTNQTDEARRETLQKLIAATEQQLAAIQESGDSPSNVRDYIEKHVQLRMLYMMAGKEERAVQAIPAIDPAHQEYWQQSFFAINSYFSKADGLSMQDRATDAVGQLRLAIARLREDANLQIGDIAFCQAIDGFGNFRRFDSYEFSPGQLVLLYAEIRNFRSRLTEDDKYQTVLQSTIEFYRPGPQGGLIKKLELPVTNDLCRKQRFDYFNGYRFEIPREMTVGYYVLKLTVTDQLGKKVATSTANFTVK